MKRKASIAAIAVPAMLLLLALVGTPIFMIPFPEAEAQEPSTPPATRIVIRYRCAPDDRPAVLAEMRKSGTARFEGWKNEGVIGDYLLLFNSFCDENTWDMLTVLSFDSYQQTDRWRDVEERFPGGLSKELLAMATPTQTYLSEARWSFGKEADKKKGLYMVIPYEHPDRDVYVDFVNSVLVPQFDGWVKEGALNNWSILLNNHYPGKPWDVLLLLEYDGIEGLAHRETARKATAKRLEEDAAWKLLREVSLQFRSEYEVVTARPIVPE